MVPSSGCERDEDIMSYRAKTDRFESVAGAELL
jgi:hypothetical protein